MFECHGAEVFPQIQETTVKVRFWRREEVVRIFIETKNFRGVKEASRRRVVLQISSAMVNWNTKNVEETRLYCLMSTVTPGNTYVQRERERDESRWPTCTRPPPHCSG